MLQFHFKTISRLSDTSKKASSRAVTVGFLHRKKWKHKICLEKQCRYDNSKQQGDSNRAVAMQTCILTCCCLFRRKAKLGYKNSSVTYGQNVNCCFSSAHTDEQYIVCHYCVIQTSRPLKSRLILKTKVIIRIYM